MDGTVKQILEQKGFDVETIAPTTSIIEAAGIMVKLGIGSLAVVEQGELIGILHERDISRHGVSEEKDLDTMIVRDIMDTKIPIVSLEHSVMEAMSIINHERVRHLPVIDNGKLVGLISIGDLNHWALELKNEAINQLVQYINGSNKITRK